MDAKDAEDRTANADKTGTGRKVEGRNPTTPSGAFGTTARRETTYLGTQFLMEEVLEYQNIRIAVQKVRGNKGAPGVDKMTTESLKSHLATHWTQIRQELLGGTYRPSPVRQVEIPKPSGRGMRKLGIPTVIDRLIQQALHQVLSPIFDPEFSENSFGFRPGRNALQAISKANEYVASGRTWVVDTDLEQFFDRVNHDILMARVARKIKDKRVLLLIRRYLQAGIMVGGLETMRVEGTPQGGPLSPLLSNILLDEFDKELEKRGHLFCRYADDCNIYVRSQKAGERVMQSVRTFLEKKLKLKVNEEKSAVAPVGERKFLGYTVTSKDGPKIAKEAMERFKKRVREQFRKGRGRTIKETVKELKPKLMGWANYFYRTEDSRQMKGLDQWIRHKLRDIIWRQLKTARARMRAMTQRGVNRTTAIRLAWSRKGPWRCSLSPPMQHAYRNKYFEEIGLVSLLQRREYLNARRTAVYGSVRTVV